MEPEGLVQGSYGLRLGKDNICILSLCQPMSPQKLTCERHIIPLPTSERPSSPSYEAVSYVWGPKEHIAKVYIKGSESPISVSATLEPALRNIWSLWPDIYLWCDSLCIDQNDPAEKGQQVMMMGDIFSHAKRVLVWLGPATAEVSEAFKILRRRTQARKLANDKTPPQDVMTYSEVGSLHKLTQHPWFYRAWTFQEARVTQSMGSVGLLYDRNGDIFPLSDFKAAIDFGWTLSEEEETLARSQGFDFPGFGLTLQLSQRFTYDIKALQPSGSHNLLDLLLETWSRECYDPRDKVYALLSTALFKRLDHGLTVDYTDSETVTKLYVRTARVCINMDRSLRTLQLAGLRHEEQLSRDTFLRDFLKVDYIPSWVPDWRAYSHAPRLAAFAAWNTNPSPPDVKGFDTAAMAPTQFPGDSQEFLELEGAALGILQKVDTTFPGDNISEHARERLGAFELYSLPKAGSLGGVLRILQESNDAHGPCRGCTPIFGNPSHDPRHRLAHTAGAWSNRPEPSTRGSIGYRANAFGAMKLWLGSAIRLTSRPKGVEIDTRLPEDSKVGDWLCLLQGTRLPFVLRPVVSCSCQRNRYRETLRKVGEMRPAVTIHGYKGADEAFFLVGSALGNWNHEFSDLKQDPWPSTFVSGRFLLT